MLSVFGSNLKMVKFFMQHLWMLHVVVVWPGSYNNVAPGHVPNSIFNTQYVAKRRNRLAKGVQHVASSDVVFQETAD